MSSLQVSKELLFLDGDLNRSRWAVEKEKVNRKFSGFSFYASGNTITSVQGYLYTSYGNSYYVNIAIPENYPYQLPTISLPYETIQSDCPHRFDNDNICIMKPEQWSTVMSLALIITKTAVWLNKYDYWKQHGTWPGKEQLH